MHPSDCFVDCEIYLAGFSARDSDDLKRLIDAGDGIRAQDSGPATHAVIGPDFSGAKLKGLIMRRREENNNNNNMALVNVDWLLDSIRLGKRQPTNGYLLASGESSPVPTKK